jgi:hypothetical protein
MMIPGIVSGRGSWEPLLFCPVGKPSPLRKNPQEPKAGLVHLDVDAASAPPADVALDLFHLGRGGTAGLGQAKERGLGAHRHPLGNKGVAISGEAVDAPVSLFWKLSRMCMMAVSIACVGSA